MAKPKKRQKSPTEASRADRHVLYEQSVQEPEAEMDFVESVFTDMRGRAPITIREDFCGTAYSSSHWVQRKPEHRAFAVDIDADVLAWGRDNHVASLTADQQARITLIEGDVKTVKTEKVDALLAMNFSYYLFKTREGLRDYFRRARENLVDDGVLFLDAFGGYDAFRELEEERECDGFDYIWDQATYDPITGDMTCHIHFAFEDGSELREAFTYHWRLWTLPEIQEILKEAGFRDVTVYWEGTDEETGEGDGEFTAAEQGEADAGWICYVVAER
ncbi:class I SAM-dependent methyltransferase [Natronospira bacteriovora]|uniref:Class I SAM-dependent methyltransferase n=1 Tax=Natronospira bacteriovora TaxID=3069753 RepID=A0ABU0W578_9GAMM|nr:class I SAM-dependent methyltransferase [Natronospira sp. AB-CW4]MDQ2069104.1 class I SAM-dependent methyltransferase [Natronospira sp. AB-CW4]